MVWRKKTNTSLKPVITGAIIFPLFGLALKMIPGYFLLIADNPVSKAINSNVWLSAVIGGGLLAGIFEEGGRFVVFKYILKKYSDRKDAVSYGIGHGGFESIYVGFGVCFSYAAIGFMINSGNADAIFGNLDGKTLNNAIEQIKSIAESHVYFPVVLGTLERIAAIVIHTVLNGLTGFVNAGILTSVQLELTIYIYVAIVAFFAGKVYKSSC